MASVGLEHHTNTSANPQIPLEGGANSGAPGGESQQVDTRINPSLAAALAMIADLPLTRDEKAEAVRRLLAQGDELR